MSRPESRQDKDTLEALARMEKDFSAMKTYLEQMVFLQKEILDRLGQEQTKVKESEDGGLDAGVLLRLPDHLRKTMIALSRLIEGRADGVAKITGRARAIESGYLNQLVRMGYVKKMRRKHQIYFSIEDGYNYG